MGPARPPRLENLVGHYLVRLTKPKLASSHDWHVQLCCQRSVTDNRLGGPFGSRTQAHNAAMCPRTWCAAFVWVVRLPLTRWLRSLISTAGSLRRRFRLAPTFLRYRTFVLLSTSFVAFLFLPYLLSVRLADRAPRAQILQSQESNSYYLEFDVST